VVPEAPWRRPAVLLAIPVTAYALSYLYLAAYHGSWNLLHTVIHESGRYTLLETTLYASHFLGHVPVLVVLILMFVGVCRTLSPQPAVAPAGRSTAAAAVALLVLVVVSALISVWHFGAEDTIAYVTQQRQRAVGYERGGSWNLHLPSTVLLFALVPPYVALIRTLLGRGVEGSRRGLGLIVAAGSLTVLITWVVNGGVAGVVAHVWSEPRYLAHSVRELATFPVTYFPVALAPLLAVEPDGRWRRPPRALVVVLAVLGLLFMVGLIYQSAVALGHDIGALAQQPDFARGGRLSIAYLLASHCFEHVLDSLFFALGCVVVAGLVGRFGRA
jgi:hypothetical protein